MGFVCEAYLQLVEKAVPSYVSNICVDKSKPDLSGQIRSHYPHVKVNQILARNGGIRRLCVNPAKSPSVEDGVHLASLQDTLGWMPGVAGMLEHSK